MKIPLLRNTLTNYLSLAVRMAEGILVVRWMVGMMGKDIYGLWGILWSFFAYAILADFGFGVTARKYTAQRIYEQDLPRYNRILSTIFAFYGMMMIPLAAAILMAADHVETLFRLREAAPEMIVLCRRALLLFGFGTVLIFPTTIFNSILVGFQRLYMRNLIEMVSKVLEFAGVIVIFLLGFPPHVALLVLVGYVMGLMLLSNLAMGACVFRILPGLRLFRGPRRDVLREIFSFSGWIYLGSVARLLHNNLSPILVGSFCGLSLSGSYQVGRRFPQMMYQLTAPYQENAGPLAARFHARGKRLALGRMLVGFMRWNALISTGLAALVFVLSPELIYFFFRLEDAQAVAVCRLLTATLWLGLVLRSVPHGAFVMAERHRQEILLGAAEAVVTLVLTIVFLKLFPGNVAAVAAVSLAVTVCSNVLVVLPMLRGLTGIPCRTVLWNALVLPLAAGVPAAVAAAGMRRLCAGPLAFRPGEGWDAFMLLALCGAAGVLVYSVAAWWLLLSPMERDGFRCRFLTAKAAFMERFR